jgi:hypothetical protein
MGFNSRKINNNNSPFLKGQTPTKRPGVFFGPAILNQTEKKFLPSRKLFVWLAAAFVILLYIIWSIANLFAPPKITIYEPTNNYVTTEKIITIKGRVSEKSLVMINDQIIELDNTNAFEEKITLVSGVNVVEISAKKKISRESVVLRQIIVK